MTTLSHALIRGTKILARLGFEEGLKQFYKIEVERRKQTDF